MQICTINVQLLKRLKEIKQSVNLKRSKTNNEPTHYDRPMVVSCRVNRYLINTEGH